MSTTFKPKMIDKDKLIFFKTNIFTDEKEYLEADLQRNEI